MKLQEEVRAALPGEPVIAAAVFDVGPDAAGIPVGRRVALAVTPERLHAFQVTARMMSRKLGDHLGAWGRDAVIAAESFGTGRDRLTVNVHSEGVWLDLTPPPGTPAAATAVAHELVQPVPAPVRGGLVLPPPPGRPAAARKDTDRSAYLRRRAGMLAIAGGAIRLLAYLMPWLTATSKLGGTATLSGVLAVGVTPLNLFVSIGVIAAGIGYLWSANTPVAPVGIGVAAFFGVLAFGLQLQAVHDAVPSAEAWLASQGMDDTVAMGFGVWAELFGVLLIAFAAIVAVRAFRAMTYVDPARVPQPAGRS